MTRFTHFGNGTPVMRCAAKIVTSILGSSPAFVILRLHIRVYYIQLDSELPDFFGLLIET